jgi:V/A-type H+-transporting ATPase subunit D
MIRVPPGRAGRSWLTNRLTTATRATELLDHKLRSLQQQQRRLHQRALATREQWQRVVHEADAWLLRAVLAGGQRSLRLATPTEKATVEITWTTTMGVRYPADAACRSPDPSPARGELDTGTAVLNARNAHREALQAAVRHAAALAAVRAVEAEITTTRRRVRALNQRWIPQLQQALWRLELTLEEQERQDRLARRNATNNVNTLG